MKFSFKLPLRRAIESNTIDLANSVEILALRSSVFKGTTANRPQLTPDDVGILYLDTTLAPNGKPIWWNGSNWIDYLGTIV